MNSAGGGPFCSKPCVSEETHRFAVHLALLSSWPSTSGTVDPFTARVFVHAVPDSLWWKGLWSQLRMCGSHPSSSSAAARTLATLRIMVSKREARSRFETLYLRLGLRKLNPYSLRHRANQLGRNCGTAGRSPRTRDSEQYAVSSPFALVTNSAWGGGGGGGGMG